MNLPVLPPGMGRILFLAVGAVLVSAMFLGGALRLQMFAHQLRDAQLPFLTDPADVAAVAPALNTEPTAVTLTLDGSEPLPTTLPAILAGDDPLATIWAEAQPAVELAPRVGARELTQRLLEHGAAIRLSGTVQEATAPDAAGRRRLTLGVSPKTSFWVQMSPGADVPARGKRCQLAGILAYANDGSPRLLAARPTVTPVAPQPIPSDWLDHDAVANALGLPVPDGNDILALNTQAGAVHRDIPGYSARAVHVTGIVIRSWIDVDEGWLRVLFHHRDAGPLAEVDSKGKAHMASRVLTIRLYEAIMPATVAVPPPDSEILMTGYFTGMDRFRIESGAKGATCAYAFTVAASSCAVLPKKTELPYLRGGIIVVSSVFMGGVLWRLRHDWREYRQTKLGLEASRKRRDHMAAARTRPNV